MLTPDELQATAIDGELPAGQKATDTATVVDAVTRLFGDEPFSISDLGSVGHPVVYASTKLAELTGFPVEEVVGRNLGFLLRNDTDQEGERLLRKAMAAQRHVTTVVRTYRADGSLLWMEQRHYPIHAGSGAARHLLTLFRDVTAEVHANGAQAMQFELSGSLEGDGRFFSYALLLHDDGRNEVAWVSDAWQQLTGYSLDDLATQGLTRFVHPDDRAQLAERFQGLREQERRSDQFRLITVGGKVMWVEDFASRSWRSDEAGITAVYGMMKDVSNARRDTANLWRLAHVDPLTGLPNAHLLEDRVQQAQLQARRNGTSVALAILDLDHFRFVNQTFSQRHGDKLIAEVSRRLRRTLRRTDTLARLEGDAFALLLADLPTPRAVLPALEKVLASIREPYSDGSLTLNLSASIGVDMQRSGVRAASQMLERATAALVRAKETHRGAFRFYEDEIDVAMRSRLAVEGELKRAISEDQLLLHYQPRVQLDNGAVNSVEALVRWLHPVRGLLKPADFVPLVEESQLGPQLFEWVVERACRQAKRWQRQRTPRRVAVNVSPSALAHADLGHIVQSVLSRYDLHPGLLELEISERTGHETLALGSEKLEEVRAMGVHVALDDFGVAHSSLTQLRALPLDGLKIDRSFVSKLDARTPSLDVDLLRAIIALGKSLRLRVTAEGIETKEQNNILRSLQCDEGQGFLFSQPVPAEYVMASA